jgi:hydrogenase maturation factor
MLVDSIMAQVQAACHDLGILLVGGHTEVTYGLDRPIAIGCMLGEPLSEHIVSSSGIQLGDIIILAGAIAIEGTALIAREFTDDLRRRGFDEAFLARARGFLRDPGISVVRAARIALQCGGVHAMHDPTEGGVATGLHEMAQAAGIGLVVNTAAVPVLPECQCLCTTYGLNPLGLIASGALLVAVRPEAADSLLTAYAEAGIPAAAIATAVQPAEGIRLVDGSPLPIFTRDEVTRLF